MRRAMLEALEKKYEAEIAAADATIHIYLNNSVGIGEHPQHLDEIDKQLSKIVEAEEKQNALQTFKL
jgi:CO dehydrogenase nickel-insertion accessory protein CooC1